MIGPLVNQFVLRLRRPEFVKVKLLIINLRPQFVLRPFGSS